MKINRRFFICNNRDAWLGWLVSAQLKFIDLQLEGQLPGGFFVAGDSTQQV